MGEGAHQEYEACFEGVVIRRENQFFYLADGEEKSLGEHDYDDWGANLSGVFFRKDHRFWVVDREGEKRTLGKHAMTSAFQMTQKGLVLDNNGSLKCLTHDGHVIKLGKHDQGCLNAYHAGLLIFRNDDVCFRICDDGSEIPLGACPPIRVQASAYGVVMKNSQGFFDLRPGCGPRSLGNYPDQKGDWEVTPHGILIENEGGLFSLIVLKP